MKGLLIFLSLLLAGCIQLGEVPHPQNYYLLEPLTDPVPVLDNPVSELTIDIQDIVFPSFIDKPYIVFHDRDNLVTHQQAERWAEPVGDNLQRVIHANLTRLLNNSMVYMGPWEQRPAAALKIEIRIEDFSGQPGSTANLTAFWRIDGNGTSRQEEFRQRTPIGPQVADLVKGLNKNLDDFSIALARDLKNSI